jgi:hypothetical protein
MFVAISGPRPTQRLTIDAPQIREGWLFIQYIFCLIEPVQDVRGWVSNWFSRAFLHTRIEWIGGVDENLDDDEVNDFGPIAASRKETITWHGYALQGPPLDLRLLVSERRA